MVSRMALIQKARAMLPRGNQYWNNRVRSIATENAMAWSMNSWPRRLRYHGENA